MPVEDKPGVGDVFRLISKSPALMITAVVGVGGIIFILMRKNSEAVIAPSPDPATGDTSRQLGGYYIQYDTIDNRPVVSPPVNVTVIAPPNVKSSTTAFVRGRFSTPQVEAYDKGETRGVPVRGSPGGDIVGYQSYGSQITIIGDAVTGRGNLKDPKLGSYQWLPVNGGFISAYDLTGLQV